tara:strand:+ start:1331 stop:1834 length:504 start_codon:yes stop_codon:yes gene_type:complete
MASTATNKQPLLVDRVFHELEILTTNVTGNTSAPQSDLGGTNQAKKFIDCTSNDGATVESIYCHARGTNAHKVNFYITTDSDFLRSENARFIGRMTSSTTEGAIVYFTAMPTILAPVPQVANGSAADQQAMLNAIYVPKGKCLWAAIESTAASISDAPVVGVQGGYY